MKSGLVIQGPIESNGFGPFEFKPDGSFQKDWLNYDARVNILETIESAVEYFDFVVLATWKLPDNHSFISNLSKIDKLHIVELEENSFLKEKASNGYHKYHQIFTTRAGAAKLFELGATLMSKCRTDQTLSMDLLFAATVKHEDRRYYSLGVPYLNLFESDRLTDFYFTGNTKVVEELCDYYLTHDELFVDVHKDYFFHFAKFLGYKASIHGLHDHSDFRRSNFFVALAWTSVFYPLDSRIFRNFHWRGRKVNSRLNSWVRWFFVLHSKFIMGLKVKAITNYFLLGMIRILKKPFVRISSQILFRKLRREAAGDVFPN